MVSDTRIGILGAGQLGRMMLDAAARLGIRNAFVLSADTDAPARQVSRTAAGCAPGDPARAEDVAAFIAENKLDILTFEIEHVSVDFAAFLEPQVAQCVHVAPAIDTLRIIKDKLVQKQFMQKHGVPVAEFGCAETFTGLKAFADVSYPVIVKARRNAYDGRGNYFVRNVQDLHAACDYFSSMCAAESVFSEIYIERVAPFAKELAVMILRTVNGTTTAYPVAETFHRDGVCVATLAPADIPHSYAQEATGVAQRVVASFPGVSAGIFGVELFLLQDGRILVNEVAPRPHNSGHYTMDACETSQFENVIRAVCGMPLGSTSMKVPYAAMLNLFSPRDQNTYAFAESYKRVLSVPGATLHMYGKALTPREARKVGHVNIIANTLPELAGRIAQLTNGEEDNFGTIYVPLNLLPPATGANTVASASTPVVSIIMGSDSDLKIMKDAAAALEEFGVAYELTIVSAHRTPDRLAQYAKTVHTRGIRVVIAGAGGAAHLPGMVAAHTPLPVIGVPVALRHLGGVDSLLSILQMPRGIPVATVAVDNSRNAALLAIRILGGAGIVKKTLEYQESMSSEVEEKALRLESIGWEVYLKEKESR